MTQNEMSCKASIAFAHLFSIPHFHQNSVKFCFFCLKIIFEKRTDTRAIAECVMKFQRITNYISFVCHSVILILSSLKECIIEIVLD